jgi:hypothetical protein
MWAMISLKAAIRYAALSVGQSCSAMVLDCRMNTAHGGRYIEFRQLRHAYACSSVRLGLSLGVSSKCVHLPRGRPELRLLSVVSNLRLVKSLDGIVSGLCYLGLEFTPCDLCQGHCRLCLVLDHEALPCVRCGF